MPTKDGGKGPVGQGLDAGHAVATPVFFGAVVVGEGTVNTNRSGLEKSNQI